MSVSFDIGILPNRPVADCIKLGRDIEKLGYDGVWLADSHSVMRDAYTILAVLAVQTERMRLASGVTHTVTRHPAVLANSWASLRELAGGRAVMGIGIGESAVANLGLKPERLAVFEEKLRVIRALLRGEPVDYQGTTISMPWASGGVPMIMACSGPRSLELGGRIADGVLFQVGSDPAFVGYALEHIGRGAEQAGRKLSDLKLYMRVACAVADDSQQAREEVKGYAAVAAGTTFRAVPRDYFDPALWKDLKHFKQNYDYAQHGADGARHSALLTDRIIDAVAIAGRPDEAIPRFRTLAGMGLDGFVLPVGMADPVPFLKLFAEQVREQCR